MTLDPRTTRGTGGSTDSDPPRCPLCDRLIPPSEASRHHLIPKLKGGARGPTVKLHRICHGKIHSVLSEAELARDFSSIDALRDHPEIARFVHWVRKRPPDYRSSNRKPSRSKRNRP